MIVFYDNFKDVICVDHSTNPQLGKLINKLLKGNWHIESIDYSDTNIIDIWIDYGILDN